MLASAPVPSPSPDDQAVGLLVAAFLPVNRGMPFCVACIAREIGNDETRIAAAVANLERSATIGSARCRCTGCSELRMVFAAPSLIREADFVRILSEPSGTTVLERDADGAAASAKTAIRRDSLL